MDAFIFCHVQFNASKNGFLTPAEMWGSFAYMGIEMGAMDVLEFLQAADMDRDGNISYRELVEILADPDREVTGDADAEEDAFTSSSPRGGSAGFGDGFCAQSTQSTDDDDSALLAVGGGSSPGRRALRKQVSLTPVEPRGEAELTRLQRELLRQEEEEERADEAEESEEEARIRRIIEEEEGWFQVRAISKIILQLC